MADFVPPLFGDFGKASKDCLGKKYDFGYSAKTVNTTAQGVKFEASTKTVKSGNEGTVKGSFKDKTWGNVEGSLSTGGSANGKVVLTKLMPNLKVSISGNEKPGVKAEATYAQDFFAAQATADATSTGCKLDGAFSIGTDGLSVAVLAKAKYSTGEGSFAVDDVNVGVNYAQKDYQIAMKTNNNSQDVSLSFWQQISGSYQVGAAFDYKYDPAKPQRALTVGSHYKLDDDTLIKLKASTSGKVSTAIEYKVQDNVLIGMAAEFDGTNYAFNATKFGVGLSFGEF